MKTVPLPAAGSKDSDVIIELDISSEEHRIYLYGDGREFRIDWPVTLYILNGSHRIVAGDGRTYRPERGYAGIAWKPREGAAPFVA